MELVEAIDFFTSLYGWTCSRKDGFGAAADLLSLSWRFRFYSIFLSASISVNTIIFVMNKLQPFEISLQKSVFQENMEPEDIIFSEWWIVDID